MWRVVAWGNAPVFQKAGATIGRNGLEVVHWRKNLKGSDLNSLEFKIRIGL